MDLIDVLSAMNAAPGWLALYAAVVSTLALAWNMVRDLVSLRLRHRTTVSIMVGLPRKEPFVFLSVANLSLQRPIHVTGVYGYQQWHGPLVTRIAGWAHRWRLPVPDLQITQFALMGVQPATPFVIPPGLQQPVHAPFRTNQGWERTRWIGVATAGGRMLWATRASTREFRRSSAKRLDEARASGAPNPLEG